MRNFLLIIFLLFLYSISIYATPLTPVNAPRAHPLAPNPHTSVGLFWIYTDANTGRQWTVGTYKVKRCLGVSCTPTTVVATGLTNADYQDTGLVANTVYGYRYLATDGSDSSDSPTVYVTTLATDSTLVQFPDATWNELLGPLPEAAQIPFSWYNSTATTNAQLIISKLPIVAPAGKLQGTGSINNGSNILTGISTNFLEQVAANNPSCLDAISIGGINAGAIASIDSNTQITLVNNWSGASQSGVVLSTNVQGLCGFFDPINDYLTGNQLLYYDTPMALWQLYFRTGDPQYMRGAIQASEAVFAGAMWLGRNRAWSSFSTTFNEDNMPAPRNFQFSGYVLLGLAGHNGVWDLLNRYLTARYTTWISNYRGSDSDFLFMREKFYTILFTSWFIAAAPDSFPQSDGTTTSLNGATIIDGDLVDGRKNFWRDQLNIDIPGFIATDQLDWGIWLEQSAVSDEGENDMTPFSVASTFQPFIGGLGGDALGYCWRNSDLSSAARNAARKEVLKLAAALGHLSYNTNIAADETSVRLRTIHYFLGGGHRLNPNAFRYGADASILNDTPDNNMITQYRQAIPLMLSTFGWAWEMSGHTWYKTIGDEMANAAFAQIGENSIGSGADGKKSLCDSTGNFKDYGQCYRTSARYFGDRLLAPSSLGTAPVVTMPSNVTLTSGINQALLTAAVSCTNVPCTYKWSLQEYPMAHFRDTAYPIFLPDDALSTKLCGLESGTYKLIFYALDNLGLEGHGTVSIIVGDGVFPPVVNIGYSNPPAIERHRYLTTSSTLAGSVKACSLTGRTLTHSFSFKVPKDKGAITITPSGIIGGCITPITFNVSGLSAGLWEIIDTVTDSAGASRKAIMYIRHTAEVQPLFAHNFIPDIVSQPNHKITTASGSTKLYVVPLDAEGIAGYLSPATGYTQGYNSSKWMVTKLAHLWSQIGGPISVTITDGTTLTPTITGLTQAGIYTFQYIGTDQQGDIVPKSVIVEVVGTTIGAKKCNWHLDPRCNQ